MSKFYQQPSANTETNLFDNNLIRILVTFHLVSTSDSWESFLVRNEFLPHQNDPIINLTHVAKDPFSPKALSYDFQIEI
jgi:hypothetical protein